MILLVVLSRIARVAAGLVRPNVVLAIAVTTMLCQLGMAEMVIPGSGQKMTQVGDDFEAADWEYNPHHPKSSRNIDKRERGPLGRSTNGRWLEGPHRGTPDSLKVVATPVGGKEGSTRSLLMQTLRTGIPGKITNKPQQDDLMVVVKKRLKRAVPASWRPNCVVHVYIPPFEKWEDRTGTSLGFRTDVWGSRPGENSLEQYWPGIFINLRSETSRRYREDSSFISIRADRTGRDIKGPEITETGWWTLGLSISPDGMCHYFASPGVDKLTARDHLTSQYCYGFRANRLDLFFFNLVAMDDGRTWSTGWIVDDPTFYCSPTVAQRGTSRSKR